MSAQDDLIFTLLICKQALPENTHPIHSMRIQIIERIIKRACANEPQLWADTLARGERVVDQVEAQRKGERS